MKKAKRGRPPGPAARALRQYVTFRLTEDERAGLNRAAHKLALTVSELLRVLVRALLRKDEPR